MEEYGIHMTGPISLVDDSDRVVVPEVPSILTSAQESLLHTLIDPLKQCEDYGKGLYTAARQVVRDMIMY